MEKIFKTDWKEVSKVIAHEDFFHKYIINPETKRLLGDVKNKVGSDFGCGNGIFVNQLMELGCQKMYAVDISSSMINLAKSNNNKNNVDYIKADVTKKVPLQNESCDFITHMMLFHSIKKISNVIKESFRVLKHDGDCIIISPHPIALMKGYFISLQDFDYDNYLALQESIFLWDRNNIKVPMEFYSRPISEYINPFIDAGFSLSAITEPSIPFDAKEVVKSDKKFNIMRKISWFIFLKFKKNG